MERGFTVNEREGHDLYALCGQVSRKTFVSHTILGQWSWMVEGSTQRNVFIKHISKQWDFLPQVVRKINGLDNFKGRLCRLQKNKAITGC